MSRLSIRSGKGLGDSLYLQSIVRHLVERGQPLEVCTPWPDVFLPLKEWVLLAPFRRDRISLVAHYISRKDVAGTDQFVDCCANVGLQEAVDLRLDWKPVNQALVDGIKAAGRPIVMVQLPRAPMGRTDGYGLDLLPDCNAIQRAIDALSGRAFVVQVGAGEPLYRFDGIDLDLANLTTIRDVLDIAWAADAAIGYCSFLVPLAESLRKPALLIWSRKGLRSSNGFIRSIVPAKIVHRPTLTRVVMDDCRSEEMTGAVDALYHASRGASLV